MTRKFAETEIQEIINMSLAMCQEKYNVDTKEEIIALIEEEVEDTDYPVSSNIYDENGFLSAYHCNAYLY